MHLARPFRCIQALKGLAVGLLTISKPAHQMDRRQPLHSPQEPKRLAFHQQKLQSPPAASVKTVASPSQIQASDNATFPAARPQMHDQGLANIWHVRPGSNGAQFSIRFSILQYRPWTRKAERSSVSLPILLQYYCVKRNGGQFRGDDRITAKYSPGSA